MAAEESIRVGDLYARVWEDGDIMLARITGHGPGTVFYEVVDDHGARLRSGVHEGDLPDSWWDSGWHLVLVADVWHPYHGQSEKASDSDHQPPFEYEGGN